MNTKIISQMIFGALAFSAIACKPAPKDPPININFNRQDTKVDALAPATIAGAGQIGATALWKKTTGKAVDGTRVRIAIIGTGIDYNIPDLREALWINGGENGDKKWNNNIDDDDNGYEDDIIGYDFYSGDAYPYDWHGHDTFTASIIAATGHANPKLVGVAPNAELMILRYLGSDGGVSRDNLGFDATLAFEYAIKNGARVIYFNWPSGGFNKLIVPLLMAKLKEAEAKNIVVVIPAGNSANQNVPAFIRDAAKLKNTLVVAGVGIDGNLSKSTNSGRLVANIAAPVEAHGYYPGGEDSRDLRTSSVAAAYVAGAAALLVSLPNYASAAKVKDALMFSAEKKKDGELLDVLAEGSLNVAGF